MDNTCQGIISPQFATAGPTIEHTVEQGPDENKSKRIVLARVDQLSKTAREVFCGLSLAIDGVYHKRRRQDGCGEQCEPVPVLKAEYPGHGTSKA